MASTYTTNIGLEKPALGDQAGTWGTTVNVNLDQVDQAIGGYVSVTLAAAGTSGSPNEVKITNTGDRAELSAGRNAIIDFTDGGDLGANTFVQFSPNTSEKLCYITNNLSGSQDLYLFQGTYNSSRDYVMAAGETALLRFSGEGASSSSVTAVGVTNFGAISCTTLTTTGVLSAGAANFTGTVTVGTGGANSYLDIDEANSNWIQFGKSASGSAGITFNSGLSGSYTAESALYIDNFENTYFDYDLADAGSSIIFRRSSGNTTVLTLDQNGLATFAGALTCGTFTSTGIDDNATAEVLQLSDTTMTFGQAGSSAVIEHVADDQSLSLNGGTSTNGARIILYSDSIDGTANDVRFYAEASLELEYDDSDSEWDFQANAIITTGNIKGASVYAGNPALTTDDAFFMGAISATVPSITFDSTDWLEYQRSTNLWSFKIANTAEFTIAGNLISCHDNYIEWAYTTEDAPFFNFVASADADTTSAISTLTGTPGTLAGYVQVDINGTKQWMAYYGDPSA